MKGDFSIQNYDFFTETYYLVNWMKVITSKNKIAVHLDICQYFL